MCVKFLAVSLFSVCIELCCTSTNIQPEDAILVLFGPMVHVIRSAALSSLASLKGRCLPPAYFNFFLISLHFWFGEVCL